MITQDSPDYLKRLEESLIKCAVEAGMIEANILHTALISAKTGYGVEELITSIFNLWRAKGNRNINKRNFVLRWNLQIRILMKIILRGRFHNGLYQCRQVIVVQYIPKVRLMSTGGE